MTDLTRPNFIERDVPTIERDVIALWESIADAPLYPADPTRLLLNNLIYREALLRIGIQYAAEQNLVNYAVGINLDQLGALLGVTRLAASKARVTLQFTRAIVTASPLVIAAGTRALPGDGTIGFVTISAATIPASQAIITVVAEATDSGTIGNGFGVGQINRLADPIAGISVTNTTVPNGGAEVELDEPFRVRVKFAPNLFSVAGPIDAYKYWVLTASQTIIDVAVTSPRRVKVNVYPLTSTGLPSTEILNLVNAVVNNKSIRPLTDEVEVLAPTAVTYSIELQITLLATADTGTIDDQILAAVAAYAADRRAGLGRDVVRSQIVAAASLPGVYSVTVLQPVNDIVVTLEQWSNCTSQSVTIAGVADG